MRLSVGLVTIVSTFAIVACSDATNPASHSTYRAQTVAPVVRIDTLFDSRYSVSGMNRFGEIVGDFTPNSSTPTEAYRFRPGVGTTFLSINATLVVGNVNDAGDVVTSLGFTQGAVWRANGHVDSLAELFPDSNTVCLDGAINDTRTVIGLCQTGNGSFYPVQWPQEGRPEVLTANGQPLTGALPNAINNEGAIVGSTAQNAAFVLEPNHQLRTPQQGIDAWSINDAGWVGGQTASGGAIWTPSDSLINLTPANGQVLFISNRNVAVGWGIGASGGQVALVWTPSGGTRQLPSIGGPGTTENDVAIAVDDKNQVLGAAVVTSSSGQMTSYNLLWTLSPE